MSLFTNASSLVNRGILDLLQILQITREKICSKMVLPDEEP